MTNSNPSAIASAATSSQRAAAEGAVEEREVHGALGPLGFRFAPFARVLAGGGARLEEYPVKLLPKEPRAERRRAFRALPRRPSRLDEKPAGAYTLGRPGGMWARAARGTDDRRPEPFRRRRGGRPRTVQGGRHGKARNAGGPVLSRGADDRARGGPPAVEPPPAAEAAAGRRAVARRRGAAVRRRAGRGRSDGDGGFGAGIDAGARADPGADARAAPTQTEAPKPARTPGVARKYLEAGARLFNKGKYELASKYIKAAELDRARLTESERVVLGVYREKVDEQLKRLATPTPAPFKPATPVGRKASEAEGAPGGCPSRFRPPTCPPARPCPCRRG